MPWIDPIETFAKDPMIAGAATVGTPWAGTIDADEEEVRIDGAEIAGGTISAVGQVVELLDCVMTGATLETDDGGRIEIINSTLTDCDLSRASIGALRASRLVGCKLAGTDLAERKITDVVFERCSFSYTNLRRVEMERVAVVDSRLSECDMFEATLEHCSFAGCALDDLANERARFDHVDLRGVSSVDLSDPTNLRGCLIDDHHVLQLAYPLAFRAGATIEREPDDAADPTAD